MKQKFFNFFIMSNGFKKSFTEMYMYYTKKFTLPGDTWISDKETSHFHRGVSYQVSKVFQSKAGYHVFLEDKHGFDMPMDYTFNATAKTEKLAEERMIRARLSFLWNNEDTDFCVAKGSGCRFNWEIMRFFKLYPLQSNSYKPISQYTMKVRRFPGGHFYSDIADTAEHLYSEDDLYSYFKKHVPENDWDNFHLASISFLTQPAIDHLTFLTIHEIPIFDSSKINSPTEWLDDDGRLDGLSFKEFLGRMGRLIFDNHNKLTAPQFGFIKDAMILYKVMPSSYSGTAISKILLGKGKIKNSKADPYFGKYPTLVRPTQAFELCSRIESYLYANDIFSTKESYSSDPNGEWRDAFEFIGSKYINAVELDKLISMCDNFSLEN